MNRIDKEVCRLNSEIGTVQARRHDILKNLDLFILDNSIRESTVGQLRSHTLEDKIQIYEQVKECGIEDIIVASFTEMKGVDDDFCQYLIDQQEDFTKLYSFSEIASGLRDGVYDVETVPISLQKNKKFGLQNVVFEADLADRKCKWEEKFTVEDMCQLLLKWTKWVHDNIHENAQVLLNIRDLPYAMTVAPARVLRVVHFLAQLPDDLKMFALCFEDPLGEYLPEEFEVWTASLRRTMDSNGWKDGKLLVHIHEKWGLQMASQLNCLCSGADGVWASLCEEGGAMGHACSSVTLMNLVRLGNKKVLQKYNCTKVRNAAKKITQITTGKDPPPKQIVYGEQALDLVFGALGMGNFDLAAFFGEKPPDRITTDATVSMIKNRLISLFGNNAQFTEEMARKMKEKMLEDLHYGRKNEYMSEVGISILFSRSGGKLTPAMNDTIMKSKIEDPAIDAICTL
jgi:hypothetical protein